MKQPTNEALEAARALVDGDGDRPGQTTTGNLVFCLVDIQKLARLLDSFRGKLLDVPDDSKIEDPEPAY